jgi:protein-disulfide isomerase
MTTSPVTRRERRRLERAERVKRPRAVRRERRPWYRAPMGLATLGALALGLVLVAFALATNRPSSSPGAVLLAPSWSPPAALVDGTAIGKADAPVTVEVVSDFQCPVCGRFAREYLPRLVAEFAVPGTARFVDRPIAFLGRGADDESLGAAVGATCAARQGRYWTFHDYLMWNQEGENEGAFAPDRLAAMAGRTGLDVPAWTACTEDPGVASSIRGTTSQTFAAGIDSTPTFIVNGQVVTGLVGYDVLAGMIRDAAG